jgi:hypothetical protein
MVPPCFYIFVIIFPLKRTWSLICTILHSPYLIMICSKFDWNWPAGSGEDFYICNFFQCIFILSLLCHLEGGGCLSYVQFWIPFASGLFCQLWLKLAQRFWRRSRKCKSLTDKQTNDGQWAIRKAQLTFQLRWTKKNNIFLKTIDVSVQVFKFGIKVIWNMTHSRIPSPCGPKG